MRSSEELNRAMEEYADTVRRICFVHLKNRQDTEDVFQEVYVKYLLSETVFENGTHEKAWFIRVTVNACTDWLRTLSRRKQISLEELIEEVGEIGGSAENNPVGTASREILETVLRLPEKYRDVIYLYYYEGYSALEIAGILRKKENTIYTWLSRAKEILRKELGGDWA
ncbi:MAG: RNA polymerase sigma factor [Roseburia sp.]|nr:RNA polymerase sigma factor [Roseburia sp.]MCM1097008.1 RNA polymerase sigma factor [Ruminococcus flavefaciens]